MCKKTLDFWTESKKTVGYYRQFEKKMTFVRRGGHSASLIIYRDFDRVEGGSMSFENSFYNEENYITKC